MASELWTEKYRPTSLDDYVWVDPQMRTLVESWIAEGVLPHCLFSGVQGTGKTTLSKMLMKELKIDAADILEINASRERQIDAFQDRIVNFIGAWAMGESGMKYILLDECDRMSPTAQGLLRSEMETYAHTCRFIATCNYPQRIIPAIHSRMQEIRFKALDHETFALRVADILQSENRDFDPEILMGYVSKTYPDLRKCINLVQQCSRSGTLSPIKSDEGGVQDYLLTMLDLFRAGRFLDARKLIIAQINPEEYEDFYRILYQNLPLFGATQEQQDDALLAIRKGLVHHALVGDPEINASATLCELSRIAQAT